MAGEQNILRRETIDLLSELSRLSVQKINVVEAYTVKIAGKITLPGGTIFIYARDVMFEPGSQIDLRGKDADKTFPPGSRAQDGQGPGQDGANGDDGGKVTLAALCEYTPFLLSAQPLFLPTEALAGAGETEETVM
jgi:hypothetical protein